MSSAGVAIQTRREVSFPGLALSLFLGVVAWALASLLPLGDSARAAQMAAGVTGFTASLWITGALPLGAASLVPLALLPMLGVLSVDAAASAYAHPIIWMFFGGFVLALGVERWGLHHRLALLVLRRVGTEPARIVLGTMLAAGFLSMWLSNTATTLLFLPIALALIDTIGKSGATDARAHANFALALLLGLAYACSIGGMATPIGSPPNAIFLANLAPLVQRGAPAVSFFDWMMVGLPLVLLFIPVVYLIFRWLAPMGSKAPEARAVVDRELGKLAPIDAAELRMLALFGLAALLWTTRRDINLGALVVPGWWHLLPVTGPEAVGDGAVAVFVAVLAFVVPSGRKPNQALMDWETAKRLPWDILLLFGGGIAIARAFSGSGLAASIGAALQPTLQSLPALLIIASVCLTITLLTEITSNTAISALFMPILLATAIAAKVDPRLLMLPAAFSASAAFMLPVATPPNAIVCASGHIDLRRMARLGLLVNLAGVVLVTLVTWFVAVPLWHVDTTGLPSWAQAETPESK